MDANNRQSTTKQQTRQQPGHKSGQKPKTKKQKKVKKHPKFWFVFKIVLLLGLLTAVALTIILYLKYGDAVITAKNDAQALVDASSPETFRAAETSIVFDKNGKQIATLKGDKDVFYVGLDSIPQAAIDAFIVTEDKKFEKHNGIDLKAIAAAFWELVKHKGEITRGASTITQQLAKNVFLTNERTVARKVKEIFISLALEKKYSKDQIMEFYLNNIYFANGYYGIEAASRGYFNKSCDELSLGEIVFLCSIPNSPTKYDPIVNMENTLDRKNRILDQMLEDEKISDTEYNNAYNTEIKLNTPKVKKRNFVETYVMNCAVKALMKLQGFVFENKITSVTEQADYDERYSDLYGECQQALYRSGYRIYTSIDMKKQKILQQTINDELKTNESKSEDGMYEFQGAGVCIDNDTGKVVAVVGGRSQNITGYTFNRAYQSYRQPGSSIKPLVIYTPAFERDYTPNDIVKDEPIKDGPKNSNGKFSGNISIRRAVEASTNTVAWKLFEELKPEVCMNYLLKMNFSKIVEKDYTLSSSLGGLTNGVSPVEMASAYAAIENKGVFREPTCIVTITDSEGKLLVGDDLFDEKQVYTSEAAVTMTDVLRGVLTSGTGRGYALPEMACAGKTGTTDEKKDGWFVGYTPYYTTSVWVGCDIPKSMDDLLGNTYPLRIWNKFMSEIHNSLEKIDFPKPAGLENLKPDKDNNPTESPDPEDDEDNEPDDLDESDDFDYVPDEPEADNVPDGIATDIPQSAPTQPPVVTEVPAPTPTVAVPQVPVTPSPIPNPAAPADAINDPPEATVPAA